jgi:uncharacterized membrane protein
MFFWFLLVSTLLCTLVTGFVFTYAIVVMPGFGKLNDREFIQAFQATDGIIQDNQPLFMLVWVGSIASVVATMVLSVVYLHGNERWVIILFGTLYIIGVQGITILVHLPLNNSLQGVKINEMDLESLQQLRSKFETRWNYFNNIRTGIACAVSVALMFLLGLT